MDSGPARLRFVAENYSLLQGWRFMLPVGIAELLAGSLRLALHLDPTVWSLIGFIPILAVPILGVGWYYSVRRFGEVGKRKLTRRNWRDIGLVVLASLIIFRLLGPSGSWSWAIDDTVVNSAIILMLVGAMPSFPWRHYLGVGLALLGVGALSIRGWVPVGWFFHGGDYVVIGLAYAICGTLDEYRLQRALPPAPVDLHD